MHNSVPEASSDLDIISLLCDKLGDFWVTDGNSKARKRDPRVFMHKVADTKPWYVGLLAAIGFWAAPEETKNGKYYRYLIGGEAFDWLLLAGRLCDEAGTLIPNAEKKHLLDTGFFPAEMSEKEFKGLVGIDKYRCILNFWYGVTVELALQFSVQQEVAKEKVARGFSGKSESKNEAFYRIYGEYHQDLFERFSNENDSLITPMIVNNELNEFTYWLFKLRLMTGEKSKVASDTRRGIEFLGESKSLPFVPSKN